MALKREIVNLKRENEELRSRSEEGDLMSSLKDSQLEKTREENSNLSKQVTEIRNSIVSAAMESGDESVKEVAAQLERTNESLSKAEAENADLMEVNRELRIELDAALAARAKIEKKSSAMSLVASLDSSERCVLEKEIDQLRQALEGRADKVKKAAMSMAGDLDGETKEVMEELVAELDQVCQ